MMKRLSIIILSVLFSATAVWSVEHEGQSSWTLKGRVGYSIGGTAPIGMPATIRKLNKFELKPNFSLGLDVQKNFWEKWGLQGGVRLENKGMGIDATVKSYYMDLVRGGQSLDGRFTGRVKTDVTQYMFTIPVSATFQPSASVLLYAGPYLSILTRKDFDGYVYNGYLRKGNPTGEKVEMGDDEGSRGYYEFENDMRPLQFGINVGADWRVWRRFGLYANLSWGLTGVFNSDFKTVEQTLYPIYGTIGITYQIK